MSLSTQTPGSAGSSSATTAPTVPTTQARAAGVATPGNSLPAAACLNRGLLRDAGLEFLPDGEEPALADQDLFRMLLADDSASAPSTEGEGQDANGNIERNTPRADLRDAVMRIAHGHEGAARQKQHSQETVAIAPLDMAALGGVVSKVYLESDLSRERVVHMALNEDLLPATKLSIFERSGRLAVDFVSTNMATRGRLRRGAEGLAERIAGDLARDVSVRVAAHDNDRHALEVRADAKLITQARRAE